MIFDTFMVNNELDMLECRLVELADIPNLVHVAVEANVDHQDHPKPFHLTNNLGRFDNWADRLHVVQAKGLPPKTFDPDPWAREHAQREYVRFGLEALNAQPDDIVLHSDVDEIPSTLVVRNIRPQGFVAFEQRGHFFSVDWLYPLPWYGTVAARVRDITSYGAMRDMRNIVRKIANGGWHFSWLPADGLTSDENARAKVQTFCHPEVTERVLAGLTIDAFRGDGWHVDGQQMTPVDVDRTWPKWIYEGRCPATWFRERIPAVH